MIIINSTPYELCLFDTNALSGLLLRPKIWLEYFGNKFDLSKTIICYSSFTIAELYFRKELYDKFIHFFSRFPSVMLDGYDGIFQKELMNYDNNEQIDVMLLAPFLINEPKMSKEAAL